MIFFDISVFRRFLEHMLQRSESAEGCLLIREGLGLRVAVMEQLHAGVRFCDSYGAGEDREVGGDSHSPTEEFSP